MVGKSVPKPNFKRRKPKQSARTRITNKVREEVLRRSEGKCERCNRTSAYSFEMSHLEQASQLGSGNDPANVVLLCGPSVNTGTCHNFADYTAKGRMWRMQKREELKRYYE
ncbi:HNH endonuclease [Oceanobacillus kimchii]|uniref:HNH endonuclease n=1 Tax=Oceanobacillus kimchii TaxID=746691 RepID=UPI003B02747E